MDTNKERSERLVKKLLKKREDDRVKKSYDPITETVQERPGRSNPTISRRDPKEEALDQMIGQIKKRRQGIRPDSEPSISAYKEGQIFKFAPIILEECPDKVEPEAQSFNMTARERLEREISDLMDKVNQSLKERNFLIKDALDVLEMARTTVYTEPLGEVGVTISEGARRLADLEPQFSKTLSVLVNLALEIKQSEEAKK